MHFFLGVLRVKPNYCIKSILHAFNSHVSQTRPAGRLAQLVTCLAADTCLTANPGVTSLIPDWSHTFVEIDHEIISMVILPSADSRRFVVSYKRKYVHKVLVKGRVNLQKHFRNSS